MDQATLERMLSAPVGVQDVVLDTDAFNEIDDQFALAYLLKSPDRICPKAIFAAPFLNHRSASPKDGMEKSYEEILRLLRLCHRTDLNSIVYKGSECYLPDEQTPVSSPAAERLVELSLAYSSEHPLYIVAIGAITNIASALLMDPSMAERSVVVWLGGHGREWPNTKEFNLWQDVAAARVVFSSGVPLVQLPCCGVVDHFALTEPELDYWLKGKNPLADYLAEIVVREYGVPGKPWSKVVWDVTAVAWMTGAPRYLAWDVRPRLLPGYDGKYESDPGAPMVYVFHIHRDRLMEDLIEKLVK